MQDFNIFKPSLFLSGELNCLLGSNHAMQFLAHLLQSNFNHTVLKYFKNSVLSRSRIQKQNPVCLSKFWQLIRTIPEIIIICMLATMIWKHYNTIQQEFRGRIKEAPQFLFLIEMKQILYEISLLVSMQYINICRTTSKL